MAVLIAAAVVATAAIVGALFRAGQGRVRTSTQPEAVAADDLPGVDELGSTATLVQFSTEFCSGCVPTRRLLGEVAAERDGVIVREIDLTERGDLAARLHILQTPTVFVLDREGRLAARIGGLPRRQSVLAALETVDHAIERHAS